jgi:hypothetical protein
MFLISNFRRVLNILCFLLGNFILHKYPPMQLEQTECSETSAYKIQTPGNYPEESIRGICFLGGRKCICFKLMSIFKKTISQYIESTQTGCLQSVVNFQNRNIYFFQGSTAPVGLGHLYKVPRSHSHTPYSVGHPWTSDESVSQTST